MGDGIELFLRLRKQMDPKNRHYDLIIAFVNRKGKLTNIDISLLSLPAPLYYWPHPLGVI